MKMCKRKAVKYYTRYSFLDAIPSDWQFKYLLRDVQEAVSDSGERGLRWLVAVTATGLEGWWLNDNGVWCGPYRTKREAIGEFK